MRNRNQLAILAVLLLAGCGMAAGQTASGTLNATLVNKSGIAVVFDADPAGVPLTGSGTPTAGLNFGTVAMYMAVPPPGVTLTRTAVDFTVSTPFDTLVIVGGVTTASYRLSASLQSPAGIYSYGFDGITLTTASQVVVNADPNYGKDVPHTLSLTIPKTAPPGVVSNTVNFVVTAN
jgi:hypothetical protein